MGDPKSVHPDFLNNPVLGIIVLALLYVLIFVWICIEAKRKHKQFFSEEEILKRYYQDDKEQG